MKQLNKMLKEHNLPKELLNDPEFIEASKQAFKENNVEFSSDIIVEVLSEIQNNLEKSCYLSDEELKDVAGGAEIAQAAAPHTSTAKKVAGIAARATSIILGTLLGCGAGLVLGSDINFERERKTDENGNVIHGNPVITGGSVGVKSGVIGAVAGSVLGNQLGKIISKKLFGV